MENKYFIYLLITAYILYNTYEGYRNKRNIVISFFTSIILTFGAGLSLLAWGAFFYMVCVTVRIFHGGLELH